MSSVPSITLNDGHTIPQLGFGVFQIKPDRHRRGGAVGARGRLPPHRHRPDVRQREGSRRRRVRDVGPRPRRGLRHQQAQQRVPPARRRAARVRRARSSALGLRLRRPVPDPLAAADALRRRLRVDLEDARGVHARTAGRARSASRTSRSPIWSAWLAEGRRRAGRQPDRGAPVLRATSEVRAYGARARHRDRGLGADRAGQGARRPDASPRSPTRTARRRRRSCCAGTSSAATSSSRSR